MYLILELVGELVQQNEAKEQMRARVGPKLKRFLEDESAW